MSSTTPQLSLPDTDGFLGLGRSVVHKMPSSSTIGMEDEEVTFDSPNEEANYYRERYRRILDMLNETRNELDEFQASSKELEDELEKELAATDKTQAELREVIKRLEAEKDEWKSKFLALQKLHSSTTANMQREMDNLRSEGDKARLAMRELEMGNDDLERNERVVMSSMLDLESRYNRAIEEKTLLEQEIVNKQEVEEECQRLRDDIRDANNEIAILRDQISRTVPTPPSSVSVHMSPVQEASQEILAADVPPSLDLRQNQPSPTRTLPRTSSIPTLSPPTKRHTTSSINSPSAIAVLNRSTTSRNLFTPSTPGSPSISRSKSGFPTATASPARQAAINSNNAAKTKGFRLLHDLQARLKATDDKLGNKMGRRNVSAPMALKKTVSTSSNLGSSTAKAPHARVQALQESTSSQIQQAQTPSTQPTGDGSSLLSPNGWVVIDEDDMQTPTNPISNSYQQRDREEPTSPLDAFRPYSSTSTSSTSNTHKALPSRPSIPSPLATVNLSKSTSSSRVPRPPSRASLLMQSTLPSISSSPSVSASPSLSRSQAQHVKEDLQRAGSPSMLPQPTRYRAPSPGYPLGNGHPTRPQSRQSNTNTSLTNSRSVTHDSKHLRTLGGGPPPSTSTSSNPKPTDRKPSIPFPASPSNALSQSQFRPSTQPRTPSRRSSLGPIDHLQSNIPTPKALTSSVSSIHASGLTSTIGKGRPMSVPSFPTPPPVPRIPSVHLREKEARGGGGRQVGMEGREQKDRKGGGGGQGLLSSQRDRLRSGI